MKDCVYFTEELAGHLRLSYWTMKDLRERNPDGVVLTPSVFLQMVNEQNRMKFLYRLLEANLITSKCLREYKRALIESSPTTTQILDWIETTKDKEVAELQKLFLAHNPSYYLLLHWIVVVNGEDPAIRHAFLQSSPSTWALMEWKDHVDGGQSLPDTTRVFLNSDPTNYSLVDWAKTASGEERAQTRRRFLAQNPTPNDLLEWGLLVEQKSEPAVRKAFLSANHTNSDFLLVWAQFVDKTNAPDVEKAFLASNPSPALQQRWREVFPHSKLFS